MPSPQSRWYSRCRLLFLLIGCVYLAGCYSNTYSVKLDQVSNTRSKLTPVGPGDALLGGRKGVVRYFLPIPYVEVVIYEVKSFGKVELHPVIRSAAVADVANPILLVDRYLWTVEHDLKVELSPEGFIDRISYQRKPKAAEAIGALARAALSAVSPVPLPFKGDADFPEYSRVVYQHSFPLEVLLEASPTTIGPINGRYFDLSVQRAGGKERGTPAGYSGYPTASPTNTMEFGRFPGDPGVFHRPLAPFEVTLSELAIPSATDAGRVVNLERSGRNIKVYDPNLPAGAEPLMTFQDLPPRNPVRVPGQKVTAILVPASSPIDIQQIVYCPDPQQVDLIRFPEVWLATRELDLRFSAGTVREIRVHHESEIMAAVNAILGPANSVTATASGIFTVNVHHDGERPSSGDKGTRGGGNQQPKE